MIPYTEKNTESEYRIQNSNLLYKKPNNAKLFPKHPNISEVKQYEQFREALENLKDKHFILCFI